jgi:hypothetical protein
MPTSDTLMKPPDHKKSCALPWILLGLVVVMLAATAWWGYNKRESVAQYAVSSLLDQQLNEMLPEGVDATSVALRVSALMRAVNLGQMDGERLRGMGEMFRSYYDDKKLDRDEFESLLAFAEAAVKQ